MHCHRLISLASVSYTPLTFQTTLQPIKYVGKAINKLDKMNYWPLNNYIYQTQPSFEFEIN